MRSTRSLGTSSRSADAAPVVESIVASERRRGWLNAAAKRTLDLVVALTVLPVFLALLIPIAIAIKLDTRGPVLFQAQRYGQYGRPIEVLKFRSMIPGAEARLEEVRELSNTQGPSFKAPADPRITRVGRWLRRTSLDELPQILAVLKGDMSVVGPRPVQDLDFRGHEDALRYRNQVKPGLTGLWQVSGRSNLPFAEMMELDLRYVDEQSLWLDLKILARTVPAVLSGRGAM